MQEFVVVVSAFAALPAAWLALVLVDRIPDALPTFHPTPRVPFPRGLQRRDVSVYPLTILAFVLAAARFEPLTVLIPYLGLFVVFIALSVMDFETLRLPDRLVLPSIAASALVILAVSLTVLEFDNALAAGLGGLLYFGIMLATHLVYPRGMGFGDVKLSFLMGMYLGWPATALVGSLAAVIWAMLFGFALGSVIGIGLFIFKGRSAPYPFGPFLILGTVAAILLVPDLLPSSADLAF